MTDSTEKCFLCDRPAGQIGIFDSDLTQVICECCGTYRMSYEAMTSLQRHQWTDADTTKYQLSGVTREASLYYGREKPTEILDTTKYALVSRAPDIFDIPARARKLLTAFSHMTKHAGQFLEINAARDYPLAFGPPNNSQDFAYICTYLENQEWVKGVQTQGKSRFCITPKGWEELRGVSQLDSDKAFVAMWFSPEMKDVYASGIERAVEQCGYRPVRIDNEEFNGDIVDQIMAEINEVRFVVADITGHRLGVYFEAGYALGRGPQVIWTCRDDDGEQTHFDAEHFNQIRWSTPEELSQKLLNRIRATLGYGPLQREQA